MAYGMSFVYNIKSSGEERDRREESKRKKLYANTYFDNKK